MPRPPRILPGPAFTRWPPVVKAHAGGYRTPRSEYDEFVLKLLQEEVNSDTNLLADRPAIAPRVGPLKFLLEHGRFYTPRVLPKGHHVGVQNKCYTNAQCLATNCTGITYVEGRALATVPCHHGWCITESGEVIDTTWTGRRGRPLGKSYFGVPIDEGHVNQVIIATKFFGPILADEAFGDPRTLSPAEASDRPPDQRRGADPP